MRLFKKRRNKEDLIRWQNLIFDKPAPFLHTTERQLEAATPAIFMRHLDIANESADLFAKTVNPETFFNRYDLYVSECEFLLQLSEFASVEYMDIPEQLRKARDQYEDIIMDFINRAWQDVCIRADKLKTEKGKAGRYAKFFETMKEYDYKMPINCVEYYKSLTPGKYIEAPVDDSKAVKEREEYDTWLDFISNGGSTAEWERMKKAKK